MVERNKDPQVRCRGFVQEDDTVLVELPSFGMAEARVIVELPEGEDDEQTKCYLEQKLNTTTAWTRSHRTIFGKIKAVGDNKEREMVVIRLPNLGLYASTLLVNMPQENDDVVSCYFKHSVMEERDGRASSRDGADRSE